MKRIFKFRQFGYKWFRFYLFARADYGVGIGFWPDGDGDYALFYIKLIIISFEITFAPNSWFTTEELRKEWSKENIEYFLKNPSSFEEHKIDKSIYEGELSEEQYNRLNKPYGTTTSK